MKKLIIGLLLTLSVGAKAQGSGTMYINYMHLRTTTSDTTYCKPVRLIWGYNGDTVVFAFREHILAFLKDKKLMRPKTTEVYDKPVVLLVKQLDTNEDWYIRVIKEDTGVGFFVGRRIGLPAYFFSSTSICER